MLAVASTNGLSLLDSTTLKRAPSSVPATSPLEHKVVSSAWSIDNACVFLASSGKVHKYDVVSDALDELCTAHAQGPISHLVVKDRATLIWSVGEKCYVCEHGGSTPKITQTFETHKTAITSLSLSNDATLLASTSSNAVHIHNLSLGSHTVLRGLTLAGQAIMASEFHPHSRTRLLLCTARQFIVCDTTRPSAPLKTVQLGDMSGSVVGIASSPFSKTLVAVATSGGNVGLVDLDKEKGLFRTLNVKVPLTSVTFSPEGATVYLGTENGKLLIIDLRALDKPPKSIIIDESGRRIEAMSFQKKTKSSPESAAKLKATTVMTRTTAQTENNPVRRPVNGTVKNSASLGKARANQPGKEGSLPSNLKGIKTALSPVAKRNPLATTKVFSPVRDPLGNSKNDDSDDISVQLETLNVMKDATKLTPVKLSSKTSSYAKARASPTPPESPPSISAMISTRSQRAKGTSTASRAKKASTGVSLSVPEKQAAPSRPRTASSASRAVSEAASAASARSSSRATTTTMTSRSGSAMSRAGSRSASGSGSSPPPVPPVPRIVQQPSRTPSPSLPNIHAEEPTTPVLPGKKLAVLGLGTPEVDEWIQAGTEERIEEKNRDKKGKSKSVGFWGGDNDEGKGEGLISEGDRLGVGRQDAADEEARRLSMQVSPRRPRVSSEAWVSPLRQSVDTGAGGAGGNASAHELLRTIVKDVMYDFQSETRAEMMGLHLDLVRMGRGWRKELRTLMDEYVGDLRDLREENQRLREENERLRSSRGY